MGVDSHGGGPIQAAGLGDVGAVLIQRNLPQHQVGGGCRARRRIVVLHHPVISEIGDEQVAGAVGRGPEWSAQPGRAQTPIVAAAGAKPGLADDCIGQGMAGDQRCIVLQNPREAAARYVKVAGVVNGHTVGGAQAAGARTGQRTNLYSRRNCCFGQTPNRRWCCWRRAAGRYSSTRKLS